MEPSIDTPDFQTTEYTEFLVQCMELRLELLRSLQTLDSSQSESSNCSDIDLTLGMLARKQSLLDELAKLSVSLKPYMNDDPEARVWTSPERRNRCRTIAQDGNRMLQQAIHRDKAAIDQVSHRRDAVAAQLQDGTDSILAHTAYTAGIAMGDSALDITDA